MIKPADMNRQTGLLSIKEHLHILKRIVEYHHEPIEIE
jgi:hypothetical protein